MYVVMTKPELSDLDLSKWEAQIRKGGLGLAVLASLWDGKLYGLEMLRRLESVAGLVVPEGTIYPLLSRLKADGFVTSEWVESEAGHPRKYYELTAAGRSYLRMIAASWAEFTTGINKLLASMERDGHGRRKRA
jgi:PadR family transcriptional regulator, regulatory protein PadR